MVGEVAAGPRASSKSTRMFCNSAGCAFAMKVPLYPALRPRLESPLPTRPMVPRHGAPSSRSARQRIAVAGHRAIVQEPKMSRAAQTASPASGRETDQGILVGRSPGPFLERRTYRRRSEAVGQRRPRSYAQGIRHRGLREVLSDLGRRPAPSPSRGPARGEPGGVGQDLGCTAYVRQGAPPVSRPRLGKPFGPGSFVWAPRPHGKDLPRDGKRR